MLSLRRHPSIASVLGTLLGFCGAGGLAFLPAAASPASAPAAEVLRLYDGPDGATCEYFNRAARISWGTRQGDWIDARGEPQGSAPAARAHVPDTDRSRVVAWDVTDLVRANAGRGSGVALLIRQLSTSQHGGTVFFSREASDPDVRPRLLVELADGGRQSIGPVADTYTDCSTVRSLGAEDTMRASWGQTLMLEFPAAPIRRVPVAKATLQLTTTARQYGDSDLGVFQLETPTVDVPAPPQLGLAAAYPGDVGIEKDPAVVMATTFESSSWLREWGDSSSADGSFDVVAKDPSHRFEPLAGRALRVEIPAGSNLGLDLSYVFRDRIRSEPEEIYFRYYVRFGDDWVPTADGGKLPGIAGTYGRAGWGGRTSDGTDGWSMRGLFVQAPSEPNPLRSRITLGTYAYHVDMKDAWGDTWIWARGFRGLVKRNTWYSVEQYVHVNTPGASDGVLRVWIDGVLAFEKTDIRVRNVPALKIDRVWMNVYHGGTTPAPRSLHLYIDNVVIARKYIGPLSRGPR